MVAFNWTQKVSTFIKVKTGDIIVCRFQCGEPDRYHTKVYTIFGARTQRSLNAWQARLYYDEQKITIKYADETATFHVPESALLLPHTIVAAPTYIQFDATRVAISPQQKECTENMFLGGLKSGSNASLSCFKGNIDFFTVINANQHVSNCLILDYYDGQYVTYSDRCNKRNRHYYSDVI